MGLPGVITTYCLSNSCEWGSDGEFHSSFLMLLNLVFWLSLNILEHFDVCRVYYSLRNLVKTTSLKREKEPKVYKREMNWKRLEIDLG